MYCYKKSNGKWQIGVFEIPAGYVWGGDFRSIVDRPHFEKTFGHTWQQLLAIKQSGKTENGYVII